MQIVDGQPVYSATDLVGFLACGHLTELERLAMAGWVEKPMRRDAELDVIVERGYEHEQVFVGRLRDEGRTVVDLDSERGEDEPRGAFYRRRAATTSEAIHRGDDVIFQACFFDGTWLGFADFLLRIDEPTPTLGWSYEVADTKLAHHVKASALIQICVYNELLERIQGRYPDRMHVALGGKERETATFRTLDVAAYFRSMRRRFLHSLAAPLPATSIEGLTSYPEPVEHCGVCRWSQACRDRRRDDDHLSLVAGIAARTRAELTQRGTDTRRGLAVLELPVSPRLERTRPAALERVREQARVQVEGEDRGRPIYELLDPARTEDGALDPTTGLLALPAPRPGDLFLDLEGDPFAGDEGMDYLFGILEPARTDDSGQPLFHAFWSRDSAGRVTPVGEKRAFEQTIDLIVDRLASDPDLHVYHYASYEPAHLGKLMGRYSTREDEVDRLLRGDRLIDLFGVVRQGLRASVESYSIKRLEPFYGFQREVGLRDAGSSIAEFEHWLQLGGKAGVGEAVLREIEDYNRDDVVSTWKLRDWLEGRREELGRKLGQELPRRQVATGEPEKDLAEWLQQVEAVAQPLVQDIPEDETDRGWTREERARRLMAGLLGWHRREQKPVWWEYFHQLNEMDEEELFLAREPLAMLELVGPAGDDDRTFRYRFPDQEFDLERDVVNVQSGKGINVVEPPSDDNEIVLKFKRGHDIVHPRSLISMSVVRTTAHEVSLLRIGQSIVDHGVRGDGPYRSARQLLLREAPHVQGVEYGSRLHDMGSESPTAAARRLAKGLERSTLAVQGPPGSGKTHAGARMILDLVAQGKKVGVTANSHKVIGNLLDGVCEAALEHPDFVAREIRIGQKPGDDKIPTCSRAEAMDNGSVVAALAADEVDVVGGTSWLWAREECEGLADVLFIDEAGQFSLANAVAVSSAADSLVLLGDPQQLDQPTKGSHPVGADRSALAHLLGSEHSVMPSELGLFMERTWRLHPDICAYTSEAFYEGELLPQAGNERQALHGVGLADGEGIRFVAVDHGEARNDSASPEEADAIADIICDLLDDGGVWTDREGKTRPITPADIKVITPYNRQRKRILAALAGRGDRCGQVPVGTVDKFQGQEAPISIYSMATSRPEDAPRGMEFLYSLNRINVATSRARCLTLVVASPALLQAQAKTPRQMILANALCRLGEVATQEYG